MSDPSPQTSSTLSQERAAINSQCWAQIISSGFQGGRERSPQYVLLIYNFIMSGRILLGKLNSPWTHLLFGHLLFLLSRDNVQRCISVLVYLLLRRQKVKFLTIYIVDLDLGVCLCVSLQMLTRLSNIFFPSNKVPIPGIQGKQRVQEQIQGLCLDFPFRKPRQLRPCISRNKKYELYIHLALMNLHFSKK